MSTSQLWFTRTRNSFIGSGNLKHRGHDSGDCACTQNGVNQITDSLWNRAHEGEDEANITLCLLKIYKTPPKILIFILCLRPRGERTKQVLCLYSASTQHAIHFYNLMSGIKFLACVVSQAVRPPRRNWTQLFLAIVFPS